MISLDNWTSFILPLNNGMGRIGGLGGKNPSKHVFHRFLAMD